MKIAKYEKKRAARERKRSKDILKRNSLFPTQASFDESLERVLKAHAATFKKLRESGD